MYEFLHRRKRLVVSATVGAAVGAGLAYWWWGSSVEDEERARRAQQCPLDLVHQTTPGLHEGGGADTDPHHLGELQALSEQQQQQQQHKRGAGPGRSRSSGMSGGGGSGGDDEEGMDESMSSHFEFIQTVSAPQELESLLPRLQAALTEVMDVQAALRTLPPGSPAADKLHIMARMSFARALGAVWLLPAMDLYVRAKLNVIGRHLFLQEKLSKLVVPTASHTMGAALLGVGGIRHGGLAPGPLPPPLEPAAIEAFLGCSHFAGAGCRWILAKLLQGVDVVLPTLALQSEMGPQELIQVLGAMLVAAEAAMGPSVPWDEVLVGGDTLSQAAALAHGGSGEGALGRSLAVSAMLEELHGELRSVIAGPRFPDALRAAVQHCFRALAAHVYAAYPEAAIPTAPGASASAENGGVAAGPGSSSQPGRPKSPAGSSGGAGMRLSASIKTLFGLAGTTPHNGLNAGSSGTDGTQGSQRSNFSAVPGVQMHAPPPKPPRPIARLLKPVHDTSDAMFGSCRYLTKGIAELAPVMALCAHIFTSTQHDHHCLD